MAECPAAKNRHPHAPKRFFETSFKKIERTGTHNRCPTNLQPDDAIEQGAPPHFKFAARRQYHNNDPTKPYAMTHPARFIPPATGHRPSVDPATSWQKQD